MNKGWLNEIIDKVFRSGKPLYFYIGINVLLFLLVALGSAALFLAGQETSYMSDLISRYMAFPADTALLPERFYTVITYQFFHNGLFHLLFNMLALYWLGTIFSDFLKPRQFHFVYLTGGLIGALVFMGAYNLFPVFTKQVHFNVLIGASASVMAIAAATATLVPDYTIRLLLLGSIKLKHLIIGLIVLDVLFITSTDAGSSFAHLGGAFAGYAYIKLLRSGRDLSSIFIKRPKLKVVKNAPVKKEKTTALKQAEVDRILDKISGSGYENLTAEEKATLFKASKN